MIQAHGLQVLKNRAGQQALERSSRIAGLSTQIHGMLEGQGNPLAFIVTAGQVHDRMPVAVSIAECQAGHSMANKAYDADAFTAVIQAKDAVAVIAPRVNRTHRLGRMRNIYIENGIGWRA